LLDLFSEDRTARYNLDPIQMTVRNAHMGKPNVHQYGRVDIYIIFGKCILVHTLNQFNSIGSEKYLIICARQARYAHDVSVVVFPAFIRKEKYWLIYMRPLLELYSVTSIFIFTQLPSATTLIIFLLRPFLQ